MNKSIVFLFSGQGSQFYHMAKNLYSKHASFVKWMLKLDDIFSRICGESIINKIYDQNKDTHHIFQRLKYTHPAIVMVEYSLAQTLLEEGIYPDYVLGTSLGEFVAAAIAGIMDPEDLMLTVIKQAEIIEATCEPGCMIAIIHDVQLYQEPLIHENSELASVNYDSHFVIAGKAAKLRGIAHFLKTKQILHQVLPVSYGFHSEGIDSAAIRFKDYLSSKSFLQPRISFISSLYGSSLSEIHQDYFWDIARKRIQFREALASLEEAGNHIYLDLGPGSTLANFVKRSISQGSRSESHAVITPFHQEIENLRKIVKLAADKKFIYC